jgi:hypothetical protein
MMTNGMTALLIAIGGTSLGFYLLMNRGQGRKSRRESGGGDTSSTGVSSSDSGWGLFSGFGSDSSSSHDSGFSSDSGGDSGGGGEMAAAAAINAENSGEYRRAGVI